MPSHGPRRAPRARARRLGRPRPGARPRWAPAAALLGACALLLGSATAAAATTSPAVPDAAPCVFWGEADACQSTDPHVTLEVLNEHETSQCTFHESWTWGDGRPGGETTLRGSIEGSTQLLATHTYTQPGTYEIDVTGSVVSEEPDPELVCEAPPVEYTFTLLPGAATPGALGAPGAPESSLPPVVTALSQTRREWRAGTALARLADTGRQPAAPVGTVFSFSLNEQASVKLSFVREAVGRLVGGRCAPATAKNRLRGRCRLASPAGTLSFTAHQGSNRASFDGRLSVSRALVPSGYQLTVAATNAAGQRSAPRSLHFTLLR